uniref:Reverse transcriptase domain-containing protein n=1 Tax=Tanacetum cinerariifolium TaxID=118510 RepID=A0A6L2LJ08_TANCI|nr:reverse transcriptase domain-containing protein [Tanacetum cinerariifolium]
MSDVTTAMTAILKQFQATLPPAFVKAVEEICVTCGGAHPHYQCLSAGGNTFPKLRDNIQGYLRNEMKNSIQASLSNQTNEIKNMMASLFQMNTASTSGSRSLLSNTVANPKGELKAITTQSGLVLDGPTVPTPPPFINPEIAKLTHAVNQQTSDVTTAMTVILKQFQATPPPAFVKAVEEICVTCGGAHPYYQCLAVDGNTFPELRDNIQGYYTYSSSNQLLEEFADELALITFPPKYDDDLQFDIESDLKEIEYLLHHDPIKDIDSILKDSTDQSNLVDLNDNLVDSMPEMFTDEHTLDYSSPSLYGIGAFGGESDNEQYLGTVWMGNLVFRSIKLGVTTLEVVTIGGLVTFFCPKKVMSPPIVTTLSVVTPTVEKTNDGFQTVGKNKKRKGKSKSTNGGQFVGPSVKQNVRYKPKATTNAPKKGVTNVGNTSQSSSMLKTTGNSSKKDNLSMSNSFSSLNDEEEDDEENVEKVYDESTNLIQNTKAVGSSSFMAAAS